MRSQGGHQLFPDHGLMALLLDSAQACHTFFTYLECIPQWDWLLGHFYNQKKSPNDRVTTLEGAAVPSLVGTRLYSPPNLSGAIRNYHIAHFGGLVSAVLTLPWRRVFPGIGFEPTHLA